MKRQPDRESSQGGAGKQKADRRLNQKEGGKMSKEIIIIKNNVPVVSTEDLAEGFGIAHKNILALLRKYQNEFFEFGSFAFETRIISGKAGGVPVTFANLTEEHSAFLITLLRASPKIVPFKVKLTKEFFRMKNALSQVLSQKQNAEWLEKRSSGKIARRQETDTIKKFVEYATAQGSESAKFYYSNITKMQNQALFILEQKYPNIRDILNLNQLSTMESADAIISKALEDGMTSAMNYKDIFKLAKSRIEQFAEIRGKTLIPAFQTQKQLQAA